MNGAPVTKAATQQQAATQTTTSDPELVRHQWTADTRPTARPAKVTAAPSTIPAAARTANRCRARRPIGGHHTKDRGGTAGGEGRGAADGKEDPARSGSRSAGNRLHG